MISELLRLLAQNLATVVEGMGVLAADIPRTAVEPSWDEIGRLAASYR